ncbi:synaptic vesicle glycoprotein 2B-like [Episyrphus balteatus]|uniref:synaptic vesicle glycoprotein 2B-like n=1 Tax=Episyrphus balteatus TaxID=286459 RepID=UPI0024857821|nr:synaptic vesicle glycoprotein 2B-like [Episyrphus balteatus]
MAKSVSKAVSIDEALEMTKFGKFNYFIISVSGFILINVIMETLGISFVLPILKCDLELTYQEKGILGAVGFLGIITSSHLWGFLADTNGRRKIIAPTLFAAYFVSIISSFSPNFVTLAVLRYLNGFLISGASATIYAYLGEFHCNKLRNRGIMSAAFVCAAAALFHPIMGWAVINRYWSFYVPIVDIVYKPWRFYIVCCGLLGFVSGLCFLILPESPKYLLSVGKEDEVIAILKRIYSINTGKKAESFEITSIVPDIEDEQKLKLIRGNNNCVMFLFRSMWNQTAPLFQQEHLRKTVLNCLIQFWIFFTAQGVYMWFPYLLNTVMQFTKDHPDERNQMCEIFYKIERADVIEDDNQCIQTLEVSTFQHTLALEFIFIIIFIFIGYFTGKLGRRPALFIILFICGSCGVLSVIVDIPIVAVYFLVVLLVVAISSSVLSAIVVDMYPTHLRAMAVCISLMIGRIGSVTGTNIVGALIENHCQMALLLASSFLLLGAFTAFLLPKGSPSHKNQNKDEDL